MAGSWEKTASPRSNKSSPPSNLLAPALVRRWAPLAMTRVMPCSRANSVRICEVSLYSIFRRQMQRSRTKGIMNRRGWGERAPQSAA